MAWMSRFASILRKGRLDQYLDNEFAQHGLVPNEVAGSAGRHFGKQLSLDQSSRDSKLFSSLESVRPDAYFRLPASLEQVSPWSPESVEIKASLRRLADASLSRPSQ